MDARHRSCLLEVRVYRGDVDLDLYLLLSEIRSRIANSKNDRGKQMNEYGVERLKEELIVKNDAECRSHSGIIRAYTEYQ
jgi:hypothetical protein